MTVIKKSKLSTTWDANIIAFGDKIGNPSREEMDRELAYYKEIYKIRTEQKNIRMSDRKSDEEFIYRCRKYALSLRLTVEREMLNIDIEIKKLLNKKKYIEDNAEHYSRKYIEE